MGWQHANSTASHKLVYLVNAIYLHIRFHSNFFSEALQFRIFKRVQIHIVDNLNAKMQKYNVMLTLSLVYRSVCLGVISRLKNEITVFQKQPFPLHDWLRSPWRRCNTPNKKWRLCLVGFDWLKGLGKSGVWLSGFGRHLEFKPIN